jgi:ketosteroid isomerase-like protein
MHKFLLNLTVLFSCFILAAQNVDHKKSAHLLLDQWHEAAAQADFDTYFSLMTSDAVFIGTDATENWQLADFKAFSKPYFDQGKAWSFSAIERNVYLTDSIIYFDELLDTQMGICRGSGVIKMEDGNWKIAHYVLSIAVPNDQVSTLTQLKKGWDQKYIETLKK